MKSLSFGKRCSHRAWQLLPALLVCAQLLAGQAYPQESKPAQRVLRVAVYPLVPQRTDMLLRIEQEFARSHPEVRLEFVDLGAEYYGGNLLAAFDRTNQNPLSADVVEVDTVFLRDLIKDGLVDSLPGDGFASKDFLSLATGAVQIDGKVYGVPHWVCSNFLFYRRNDRAAEDLKAVTKLNELEEIFARPTTGPAGVLVDVAGSTTVGELFVGALLDHYHEVGPTLEHLNARPLDVDANAAMLRLFHLYPNAVNHQDKYHNNGQFYARQFSHGKARGFIGYSEELSFVDDEFLHGVAVDEPAVGDPTKDDIAVIPAPLADHEQTILGWVDAMTIRAGLNEQTRQDALAFIAAYTSLEYNRELLIPAMGDAPRYLLPARLALYNDADVRKAAPLYPRFLEIMDKAVTIDTPGFVTALRKAGKEVNKEITDSLAQH